ncbi:MAG: transcriptional repressor LexA [Pseudomonadota bacterium]
MKTPERHRQIIEFIGAFQAREGFPPSVREVCEACGLSSPGSMIKNLKVMEQNGLIESGSGRKRAWKLTEKAYGLIGTKRRPSIPLIGQIAAGTPILAERRYEEELPVDPRLFGCNEAFAVRVRGDSMEDADIRHGDLAIIRPLNDAENGDIVAVMVENIEPEATLKMFRRKRDRIELHAANKKYGPLLFEGDDRSKVKVLGKLIGVIRVGP